MFVCLFYVYLVVQLFACSCIYAFIFPFGWRLVRFFVWFVFAFVVWWKSVSSSYISSFVPSFWFVRWFVFGSQSYSLVCGFFNLPIRSWLDFRRFSQVMDKRRSAGYEQMPPIPRPRYVERLCSSGWSSNGVLQFVSCWLCAFVELCPYANRGLYCSSEPSPREPPKEVARNSFPVYSQPGPMTQARYMPEPEPGPEPEPEPLSGSAHIMDDPMAMWNLQGER